MVSVFVLVMYKSTARCLYEFNPCDRISMAVMVEHFFVDRFEIRLTLSSPMTEEPMKGKSIKECSPYVSKSNFVTNKSFFYVRDFITKIAVACSLFEIRCSNFGFSLLFRCIMNPVGQLTLFVQFSKMSYSQYLLRR